MRTPHTTGGARQASYRKPGESAFSRTGHPEYPLRTNGLLQIVRRGLEWRRGCVVLRAPYNSPVRIRGVAMLLTGLRTRRRIPELMDDPALDPAEHRRALSGLAPA